MEMWEWSACLELLHMCEYYQDWGEDDIEHLSIYLSFINCTLGIWNTSHQIAFEWFLPFSKICMNPGRISLLYSIPSHSSSSLSNLSGKYLNNPALRSRRKVSFYFPGSLKMIETRRLFDLTFPLDFPGRGHRTETEMEVCPKFCLQFQKSEHWVLEVSKC